MANPRRRQPTVAQLIRQYARKHDVDPRAAIAVAMGEGGLRWGAVGDQGTSFGPFQLHEGGALPRGKGAKWANSPAGIDYALRKMAESGARGLKGRDAVDAIVRRFERPADPDASVAAALERLHGIQGGAGNLGQGAARVRTPKAARRAYRQLEAALALAVGGGDLTEAWAHLARAAGHLGNVKPAQFYTRAPARGGGGQRRRLPLGTPLPTQSEFNVRDPEGMGGYHSAIDWFAPAGHTVTSPINGIVVEVKPSTGTSGQVFGGTVKIRNPKNGRVWVFRHVNPRAVKVGQQVRYGQPIAGVTDWQGGSDHAHIELWKTLEGGYARANALDPLTVLSRF